ncbi:glycosyltransferase family 4 protein [Argonema antarcticum]|uniref:glycosyltransferase family 4 protein n=1 Tax=Argonema antarcticum TaxID=2942763 RepID=UPI0020138D15|nr:glycosyltransferase family 4 protein [Argonema antarcticum]MCL1472402.1 glycosyltransferase family 4 protein [Argonema antarcticum A004/B2]
MNKPVLTIFYQFNPWHSSIGGIQTIIRNFVKYAPSEFEVRLVGTGHEEQHLGLGKWHEAELGGRAIRFMPLFNIKDDNVRRLIPTTIKYTAALLGRNLASDFMHFHRLEPSVAALKWRGEKALFIHNDIHKQMSSGGGKDAIAWRYLPAAYFAIERLLITQFSQIFSCNTESAQFYQQRYPELADRVSYVKNTVDNEVCYPLTWEEREGRRRKEAIRMGKPENTQFVLFAGRLHPQKDPILLLRSLPALNEPKVHLLIAGDGDLKDEVSSEIDRLGLCDRVTMLGPIDQAELAQLQRIASVFVLTSAYEGLPVVVLEALACGTPIVTTRCGETPKLLTPNSGVVCEDRTPVAVADALRKVLLKPGDFPVEACVKAAKPYSASAVVGAIYNEMLNRWEQRNSQSQINQKNLTGVSL